MKSIVLKILYFFILNISLVSAQEAPIQSSDKPVVTQQDASLKTTPSTEEKKASTASESNATEKKEPIVPDNELEEWQSQLKSLLVKGAFWDSSENVPTNEWKMKTFDLAQNVVTKNSSLADELKTSFLTTINDKFITIEKGSNLVAIASLINEFNSMIDESIQQTSYAQKEESSSEEKKPGETADETKKESEEATSTTQESPEQTITPQEPESTPEEIEAEKKKKVEDKLKYSWKECLESIESEGLTKTEIPDMLEEIIPVIEKVVTAFPLEKDTLKSELLDSLTIRTEKALAQFTQEDTQKLLNPFESSSQDIIQQEPVIANQPQPIEAKNEPTTNNTKAEPEKKTDEAQQSAPVLQQPQQTQQRTTIIEVPYSNETTILAQKAAIEKREQAQREQLQRSLALKMQKAAQEKATADKAASQKGILSSIAETVLGEWWTGPNLHEKNIEKLQAEQMKELDTIIDTNLPEESKNIIKAAYQKFQKLLLNFKDKKYWDSENEMPNQAWFKQIKNPAFILIKHKIMSLENIIQALQETFDEINKDMSVDQNKQIYKKTVTLLVAAIKKEIEKQTELDLEEQRKQQRIIEERHKEMEQQRLEEQQKQEQIMLQEQQIKERAAQEEQDKVDAAQHITKLKAEWNNVLHNIRTSSPVTVENNNNFTVQALEITKNMLKANSVLGMPNEKELIAKHITDFSKALLAQQQNPDNPINIHANMDAFNKAIHEFNAL